MTEEAQKRLAAESAAALVEDGMLIGLGTGSTAALVIAALIRRAQEGLRITCVPTSVRSAEQARAGGLTLLDEPPAERMIDLTIDGADEVEEGTLNLIKGLGGALLREKIVAVCSRRLVIVADAGKVVRRLGERAPVPVEVVRFGWRSTATRLRALGAEPVARLTPDGGLFVTDGGNHVLDCRFPGHRDLAGAEPALARTVGVIESGLFVGLADLALIGTADGVRRLTR